MQRKKVVEDLIQLGEIMQEVSNAGATSELGHKAVMLQSSIKLAGIKNPWFTEKNVILSLKSWAENLTAENLEKWLKIYPEIEAEKKIVALIMAGNLPLVGFHDLISVLLSGNNALIKPSSDDEVLIKEIVSIFYLLDPGYKEKIKIADGPLKNFDAAIATGSDNSARYFEYYFGKYPHIIRKNRTSIAVLTGKETKNELLHLGDDIFSYFGMGCRNVSHLLVPNGYVFNDFFEAIFPFGEIVNHNKYCNNYDYHKAIFLLEQIPFLDNNFVMIRESNELFSPLSVIHYSFYNDQEDVTNYILDNKDKVQCVVGTDFLPFGTSQQPKLWDYADGVNTMEFLLRMRE